VTSTAPRSFEPTVDPASIRALKERLKATRWPAHPNVEPWAAGTSHDYLGKLLADWSAFDFDRFFEELHHYQHNLIDIAGSTTHFVHARSSHQDATPLLLTHGWPSSFLEYLPLVDQLTQPEKYGGAISDAFHVVIPSMPGFAFSGCPAEMQSYTAATIADRWQQLMTILGYDTFLASGTDIGARVTAWLATRHAENLIGAHMTVNAVSAVRDPSRSYASGDPTTRWMQQMEAWTAAEGGYHHLQTTKPLTVSIAVSDSPAAAAAWVVEKWKAWADQLDMDAPPVRRMLLSLLTLFWVTNSLGSSVFHYHAHDLPPGPRPIKMRTTTPLSFYASTAEIGGVPPRSLIEEQYGQHRWTMFPHGGHFMATEQPDLLADDLREFRRNLNVQMV
jgi:pimeloyl-ACP methyl ester carboxylesterase